MARVSKDKILRATIKGLNIAQEKYLQWTNDKQSVGTGAEYVLTTYVADEIYKVYQDYIFVEKSIKEMIEDNSEHNDINSEIFRFSRINGRADIALYKKSETPKAIIELKNRVSWLNLGIKQDIERIESLVVNNILEFGVVAFVTEIEKNTKFKMEVFEVKIKKLMLQCKKQVPNLRYKYRYEVYEPEHTIYDTHWSWASCAILFSKKGSL